MTLFPEDLVEAAARRFKALGEPVRLELLGQLQAGGERSVQALVEATGQRQAGVSKHLRVLAEAGLVRRRKEGRYAYYSISDPTLAALCLLVRQRLREETDAGERSAL